jgi:hypothetical protein
MNYYNYISNTWTSTTTPLYSHISGFCDDYEKKLENKREESLLLLLC